MISDSYQYIRKYGKLKKRLRIPVPETEGEKKKKKLGGRLQLHLARMVMKCVNVIVRMKRDNGVVLVAQWRSKRAFRFFIHFAFANVHVK